jgi:LSD1 subclass zinc finger protein
VYRSGRPTRRATGLHDVDRRSTVRIAGLPRGRWVEYVVRTGDSVVLTANCEGCRPVLHLVPPGSTTARPIADGMAVAADRAAGSGCGPNAPAAAHSA